MAKEPTGTVPEEGQVERDAMGRRKRAPSTGPRRPSPIYVFVKIDGSTGKPAVTQVFRDPRKMADYFPTAKEDGSELLVVTPE